MHTSTTSSQHDHDTTGKTERQHERSPGAGSNSRPGVTTRTPRALRNRECVGRVGQTPCITRATAAWGGAGVARRVGRERSTRGGVRRRRGDRARCDRCGQLRPRSCRSRFLPGRALQPLAGEASEALRLIRRRAVAGSLGTTAAELGRDTGSTTARAERILRQLATAGHVRPDRWRSRWMPTDYAGIMERMPAVRSLIDRWSALDATRLPADARPLVADARAIRDGITGPGCVPTTGGQSVPPNLETPAVNGTRDVDHLAGVAGGAGRRRPRWSGLGRGVGLGSTR